MTEEEPVKPAKGPLQAPKNPKKTWTNPALRTMGIRKVSLPSRNWMIFWTILASIGGGIYYDKIQQKVIREKYTSQVQHLAQEAYSADRLPRKVTVFIAPPPNDFLEESLRHFRKYIKPILNAAAIDYEVYTETRQGDIRSQVAEEIRQIRRDKIEDKKLKEQQRNEDVYNHSWSKYFQDTKSYLTSCFNREKEPEQYISKYDLFETKDVLGIYKVMDTKIPVRDNVDDPELSGGVVCIGRGTFKEYINGVHEGLLGPLEMPEPVVEPVDGQGEDTEGNSYDSKPEELQPTYDESKDEQSPVPAPYIVPADYPKGELAPELDFSKTLFNRKGVSVLFEQPIYVYPIPKITGFVRIPEKIYNYFTARKLTEEVSQRTMTVVNGKSRKFEYRDKYLAGEEEPNWPHKWVEKGKAKKSEWVQELEVDDRVTDHLYVLDN